MTPSLTSPLHVVAVITAKPGSGDELEPLLRQLAAATHSHAGCQLYSLQRGAQDPDVFVTVEKWDTQASLDAHLASAEVQGALSGPAGQLLAGAPQIIPTSLVEAGDAALSRY